MIHLDVTTCILVEGYLYFGENFCLQQVAVCKFMTSSVVQYKFATLNYRSSMESTVNVMTNHVNTKTICCVLVMAPVHVGNVSVKQTGLVTPATVQFQQRIVYLMKGVQPALVTVNASVVLVSVMKNMRENTVKNRFKL
jgi:hypothetical protein